MVEGLMNQQEMIRDLKIQYDTEQLRNSLFDMFRASRAAKECYDTHSQISFRTTSTAFLWNDGVGSLYDHESQEHTQDESMFRFMNPATPQPVMQIFNHLLIIALANGVSIGRVRLMKQKPKTCLSLHSDTDRFRFHVPVYTNPDAFFVCGADRENLQVGRMTLPGHLYTLRTDQLHTIVNANRQYVREHLVFDTFVPSKV